MGRLTNDAMLGMVSVLLLSGCRSTPTRSDIEARLTSAVPNGSKSDEVLSYLTQEKIEHSGFGHDRSGEAVITAAIRPKQTLKLIRTDYGIIFRFDNDGKLIRTEVQEWYTGP